MAEAIPGLVCFDLDGTLVDPLLGVRNGLEKTCAAFGLAMPDEATIRDWIAKVQGMPGPHLLPEAVYRACHTLSGSSKMAEGSVV